MLYVVFCCLLYVLKLVLYSCSKLSYRVTNGEEGKAGTLSPKKVIILKNLYVNFYLKNVVMSRFVITAPFCNAGNQKKIPHINLLL